jgi:hypothetical protein
MSVIIERTYTLHDSRVFELMAIYKNTVIDRDNLGYGRTIKMSDLKQEMNPFFDIKKITHKILKFDIIGLNQIKLQIEIRDKKLQDKLTLNTNFEFYPMIRNKKIVSFDAIIMEE